MASLSILKNTTLRSKNYFRKINNVPNFSNVVSWDKMFLPFISQTCCPKGMAYETKQDKEKILHTISLIDT
jgi:hypothetical protein